jgi:hypothetical protein
MLWRIAPLLLVLAACPGGHGDGNGNGKVVGGGGGHDGRGKPHGPDKPHHPEPAAPGGLLPTEGIACASPSCLYHAGGDGYYECLAGGGGACFHYGAACEPADKCMYDRSARAYHTCASVREGHCVAFAAAACDPPRHCMFDARDGLHRTCKHADGGRCTDYGDLCDP